MNRMQADVDTYLRLELIGHMLTDERWDGFEHRHSFDEMIYVLKGPITFVGSNHLLTLRSGELLFIPRDTSHRITAMEPASFVYIGLKTNLIELSHYSLQVLSKNMTPYFSILSKHLEELVEISFTEGESLSDHSVTLLSHLIPALCNLESSIGEQDSKTILSNKVKQYIKHNYQRPIRVDEIAAGLYHSSHYIGNVFASVNGMTIKEYALQYKMQKAIWMLQSGQSSVCAVAEALGYESPHYFSKCFKNYFGFSPSKISHKE